ncbi:MAG: YitT family protein [Turicibacter sp.]
MSVYFYGCEIFWEKFMMYSLLEMVSFSEFYGINEAIEFTVPNLSENMIMVTRLAGIFVGVGVGLIVKIGGTASGADVIALISS